MKERGRMESEEVRRAVGSVDEDEDEAFWEEGGVMFVGCSRRKILQDRNVISWMIG